MTTFNSIFANLAMNAHEAGMAAGNAACPTPMHLVEADIWGRPKPSAEVHCVNEGPCGFAWVWLKGNTPFGKWAKAQGMARTGYPNGLEISCHEFNQSMERKEAYATAFAKVLNAHGIACHSNSRMD